MPEPLELVPECHESVDFAVEYDPRLAIVGEHRLIGRRIEVDDGQAAKTDPDRALKVQPTVVRTAMHNRCERGGVIP